MPPRFPIHDLRNCVFADAELPSKFALRFSSVVAAANVARLLWNELSAAGAILLGHIGRIVRHGSKKQMPDVHAWRIVAFVENLESVWNWAVCNFPRNAMGSQSSATSSSNPDNSIAALVSLAGPDQATSVIRLAKRQSVFESRFQTRQRETSAFEFAFLAAKSAAADLYSAWKCLKWFSANLANAIDLRGIDARHKSSLVTGDWRMSQRAHNALAPF